MSAKSELIAALPSELSALVDRAVTVRVGGGRMVLTVCHPAWLDVAERVVAPVARPMAAARGLELVVTARRGGDAAFAVAAGFASVLEDPGNHLAFAACRRIAGAPGAEHNPLVIHGPTGSGKTLLLAATCAELRSAAGDDAVVQIDGDMLVARSGAITTGSLDGLDPQVALAVDGIDAIAGRPLAQEALFQLINRCLDRSVQILVAGRLPPNRLGLEDRLASRLGWGLVVALETPSAETRTVLLRRLAGSAASRLDAAAVARLVDSHAPDGHQVVALAQRLLSGENLDGEDVGFDRIVTVVAERMACRPTDITSASRVRELVRARQMVLMLARRHTGHSLTAMGGMLGGRDHATVIHSISEAERRLQDDPEWRRLADELTSRILGR